jgi:hypothetical protein
VIILISAKIRVFIGFIGISVERIDNKKQMPDAGCWMCGFGRNRRDAETQRIIGEKICAD